VNRKQITWSGRSKGVSELALGEVPVKNRHTIRLFIIFSFVLMVLPNGTTFAQDVAAAARASRARAASTASGTQGLPAKIRCLDESYVLVTADSERTIPLSWVAKLNCDDEIRVLSDQQGYTVQVQTTDGTIGYVVRYEVVLVPQTPPPPAASSNAASNAPAQSDANPAIDSSKPHVYVTDTQSFAASAGFSRESSIPEGKLYGGYDPELTDIYQSFASGCPAVIVTQEKFKANYAVLFDKGAGKKGLTGLGGLVKVNKITVVSRSGETIFSQTAHSADIVIKQTCEAIMQRTTSASTTPASTTPASTTPASTTPASTTPASTASASPSSGSTTSASSTQPHP
jgi:hypothetical protein